MFESRRARTIVAALAALAVSCTDAREVQTIEPADVAPSSPAKITQTIGDEPMITTSGSPPPAVQNQLGFEEVVVFDDRIEVRSLIPTKNTAFRVTNRGTRPRLVELHAAGVRVTGTATPLGPGESAVVQAVVGRGTYEIVVPGETLRATVRTYVPR